MKKAIVVLLVMLILMSTLVVSIAAEEPINISLVGSSQAIKGEMYEVSVCIDSPSRAGGLFGRINYDNSKFTIESVSISSSIAKVNRVEEIESEQIISESNGVIDFAIISDKVSSKLMTINFQTKDDAEISATSFEFANVEVSDVRGITKVSNLTTNIEEENITVYEKALDVIGASVRTNGAADIRFTVDLGVNNYKGQIAEVGVIMIPTRFVEEGQELVYDTENVKYSGKTAKKAYSFADQIGDETQFYANLINSSSSASRVQTEISARAYIKLNDGTIIYSDNIDTSRNIAGGTSSRCCIDVMKSIAAEKGYVDDNNNTVQQILKKENKNWTLDDYAKVVEAVKAKIFPE